MVNCIVLDGWHKGTVVRMPRELQSLVLPRPRVVAVDYCCDGEVFKDSAPDKHSYVLTFMSVDKKTALYSTAGNSEVIERGRDWITTINTEWLQTPLYVGMHDERAVFEDSHNIQASQ